MSLQDSLFSEDVEDDISVFVKNKTRKRYDQEETIPCNATPTSAPALNCSRDPGITRCRLASSAATVDGGD